MNAPTKFQFSAENQKKAQKILKKYPNDRQASAVMPLLDLAQRQNANWLPPEAIEYVAKRLEMPEIRVFEVATFYSMFNLSPVGKFHIQICTNLPCWLRGSDSIVKTCKKKLGIELGENSSDGSFSLKGVECLGACVNAPMMQINDDYFEDLDSKSTETILNNISKGIRSQTGAQQARHSCEPIGGLTSLKKQSSLRNKLIKAKKC